MPRRKKELSGKTFLIVVADESGSMYGQQGQVINGFNEYIEEVRKNTQNVVVSLVKFNTRTNVVFENTPIGDVARLDVTTYDPNGGTALYDGVANAINLGEQALGKNDKAILVIFTDGAENSSVENTREQVFKKITEKQNAGNWTVVFLGADQDAWAAGAALGVYAGNTMAYAGSNHTRMMRGVASATVTATASPQSASSTFFSDAGQSKEDYENPTPPAGTGG
jgi:Mg-chelatase subunit ChlD